MNIIKLLIVTLVGLIIYPNEAPSSEITLSELKLTDTSETGLHAEFTDILQAYSSNGFVKYDKLKNNRNKLDHYLKKLSETSLIEFDKWPEDKQIAYLLNFYNAATIQLIINNYPVKSIKRIGGFFKSPWQIEFFTMFGKEHNLDYIEHELLRKNYSEPKIHFALVCASKGCPPLRTEAYTASRLQSQLIDQAKIFLADSQKNYWDNDSKVLYLSPIFKWFEEDFVKQSGLVWAYISPYFPETYRKQIQKQTRGNPRIKYTDYDWSLNDLLR